MDETDRKPSKEENVNNWTGVPSGSNGLFNYQFGQKVSPILDPPQDDAAL